jgi:hypothetical protein
MMQVSFEAQGHRLLRATHSKSIEITSDRDITARATCVIGVGAKLPAMQLRQLRGQVKVTLSSGKAFAEIIGQVNPSYDSDRRLVIRRSGATDGDTFLIHTDTTADELPRALVDALRGPDVLLHVDTVELQVPPPLIIIRPDRGPHWRRAGRLRDDMRRLTLRTDRVDEIVDAPVAVELRERGARWLVEGFVGIDDPTAALLLSAGVAPSPLLLAGDLPRKRRERHQLLHAAASVPYTAILRVPPNRAKPDDIIEILGADRPVLVGDGVIDHGWRAHELRAGDLDDDVLSRPPHLLVIPREDVGERAVVDAQLLAQRLLDAGLTSRSVDDVLRDLGLGRRFLYRA